MLTRERFDFNAEFEIELADVVHLPGLTSEQPQRPWGSLDRRMRTLHAVVSDYAYELEAIAREERANRSARQVDPPANRRR